MRMRSLVVIGALMCLMGCSPDGHESPPTTAPSRSSSIADANDHQGSLAQGERSLATAIAKRQQSKVTGTFIGATAFVTQGTPFDRGSDCDVDKPFLNIRLVWKSDANFDHGGPVNAMRDGPRKDLLMTVDPTTGEVCEIGAGYRDVGAAAGETLLYGAWPSKADG